jgi:hypothetical protein
MINLQRFEGCARNIRSNRLRSSRTVYAKSDQYVGDAPRDGTVHDHDQKVPHTKVTKQNPDGSLSAPRPRRRFGAAYLRNTFGPQAAPKGKQPWLSTSGHAPAEYQRPVLKLSSNQTIELSSRNSFSQCWQRKIVVDIWTLLFQERLVAERSATPATSGRRCFMSGITTDWTPSRLPPLSRLDPAKRL